MAGDGIRVRLVSLLREAAGGAREVVIEADGERSLEEVLEALFQRYPRLRSLIEELERRGLNIVYMVNGSSAEPGARLRPGDVLTILPPASGG